MFKSIIAARNHAANNLSKTEFMQSNALSVSKQDRFPRLLSNYLSEIGITKTLEGGPDALTSDQLAVIVRKVQQQMNQRLFNAVLNAEDVMKFSPAMSMYCYNNEIKPPPVNASKNRQIPPNKIDIQVPGNLESVINKAATKYEVDPDLVKSVIKAESNYDAKATSVKGAMGLMQLMPETARDLGVEDSYNAEENVMGGTRYLKMLLDRYHGNVDLALAAYNWGMGNLEQKSGSLPAETIAYVARINKYYKESKA